MHADAVVEQPPVPAGRLQHGAVARAAPVLVGLQDRVLLRTLPGSVDALRAGHSERVGAVGGYAAAAARVEEVEPAVAADDPRPLDQAVLPVVLAPEHDLARDAFEPEQVARERLNPDRAGPVAAVFLPHQKRASIDVAHQARVDRGLRLADERAVVDVRADWLRGNADRHTGVATLLARAVVREVAVAVAHEPRSPELASAAPLRRVGTGGGGAGRARATVPGAGVRCCRTAGRSAGSRPPSSAPGRASGGWVV